MNRLQLAQRCGLTIKQLLEVLHAHDIMPPTREEQLTDEFVQHVKELLETPNNATLVPGNPDDGRNQSSGHLSIPSSYTSPRETSSASLIPWNTLRKQVSKSGGIGIIGLAGAGKTAYLYVLGRYILDCDFEPWDVGSLHDELLHFVSNQMATLNNWRKTAEHEFDGIELFRLVMPSTADASATTSRIERAITITTYDTSGEAIQHAFDAEFNHTAIITDTESTAINKLRSFFCSCEGFMIILDAQQANDDGSSGIVARQQWLWKLILERLRKLDSGDDGSDIMRPVAIVLNKTDAFACADDQQSASDRLGIRELISLKQTYDLPALHRRMRETWNVRTTAALSFVQTFYPDIYNYIDSSRRKPIITCSACFSVSCWGRRPIPENNVGTAVYPVCIEEPLRWLADAILAKRTANTAPQNRLLRHIALHHLFYAAAAIIVLIMIWLALQIFLP